MRRAARRSSSSAAAAKAKARPAPRTRAERVIAFIERFCIVPEGARVGQPFVLDDFQRRFIVDVYDNPAGTTTAILSIGRKNGKTALIAALVLVHVVGPEAKQNSEIASGARSRDQAAKVFSLAAKMVRLSPKLGALVHLKPSVHTLIGLPLGVTYKALAADATTAMGGSYALVILDELGQVRGPQDDFVDALTTSMGAHDAPLVIAISTQAASDSDLLSIWIDDAARSKDPTVVCHVYAADAGCALDDRAQWAKANPALGTFRSAADVERQARTAARMPSEENTFRNLTLNQRVTRLHPFIARSVWDDGGRDPVADFEGAVVFGGLDLSARTDLTALVAVARIAARWHVRAWFWTPEDGLRERSKRDRAPYDVWVAQGWIKATPGGSVDYEVVAADVAEHLAPWLVDRVAFDRWRIDILKKELDRASIDLPLEPFGQGFKDMSPALDELEAALVGRTLVHGNNPVLTMCAANAVISKDAAGNRKLDKAKATGRIDGMVALAMAIGAATRVAVTTGSVYNDLAVA